ncbi:MAG: restriction endonuclease subunit S [Myxococcales bacterium]|nr:restriction endonuclease subunit S [Myxococcales bacterium]
MSEDELPEGWACPDLGTLVRPSKRKAEPGHRNGRPYIGLEHIESETNRVIGWDVGSGVKSTMCVFSCGDVLYSKLRPYLNKVTVAPADGVGSTEILVFEKQAHLVPQYLMWLLSRHETVRTANERAAGVQLPRITFEKIADITVPLAPLPEQHRIVGRVEALLAEVNKAKDRLDRVKVIIKRFRQAVLAAAYSGRLTGDWRLLGPEIPICSAFDPREPGRFSLDPDVELPELPRPWVYAPIGNVASFQQGMQIAKATRFKEPGPGRLPILRIGNYSTAFTDDVEYAQVGEDTLIAEAEDLILTRTGETRGKVLTGYRGVFHNNTFRINFDKRLVGRRYLLHWLQTKEVQAYILDRSGKSAQPDLTHKAFGPCPFPIPPPPEQEEIVNRIEAAFALTASIEARVTAAASRAEKLPQAILSKAFKGELVPTEAELARAEGRSFESAEEMLKKVKAADVGGLARGGSRRRGRQRER